MSREQEARVAFEKKDRESSRKIHDAIEVLGISNLFKNLQEPEHKEKHKKGGEFLRSAVFGGLDGIITSYSVVMGSLGVK